MLLFGKKKDINAGLEEYGRTEGALLIDVREAEEYRNGHIPGAVNVPLSKLNREITDVVPDESSTLFVYCLSGARSGKAVNILKGMGYDQARNIGGINAYKGKLEK